MKIATFNVLADAYTGYGNYSHINLELLLPGARNGHIVNQINSLEADVIGIQEADQALVETFKRDERWQSFWVQKGNGKPDGCLTLIKNGVEVADYEPHHYDDESGHVYQIFQMGQLAIANTHIKWAPVNEQGHRGVSQTNELLHALENKPKAVLLADCNDRPEGPVQSLVREAGFINLSGNRPTAHVNGELVAIDLLAIRGIKGHLIDLDYDPSTIPNESCASDHIPLLADIDTRDILI